MSKSWTMGQLLGNVPRTMDENEKIVPLRSYDPTQSRDKMRELKAELERLDVEYHDKRGIIESHLREEQEKWLRLTSELMPDVIPPKLDVGGGDE